MRRNPGQISPTVSYFEAITYSVKLQQNMKLSAVTPAKNLPAISDELLTIWKQLSPGLIFNCGQIKAGLRFADRDQSRGISGFDYFLETCQ
ncbi:hypothetical protein [Roseovarius sp.]|uniref:hypothetical protein n=1 Tax=Roseovarius sp. TaxID=1486281 RepID=UPI0035113290